MNHRTITSLAVLVLAMSATAAFPGQWIPLAANSNPGRTVGLSSAGFDAIVLDVTLPGLDVSEGKTKDGAYILLSVPDQGYNTELGHPKLPVVSEWVEIPQGARVEASLEVIASESFNLKDKGFDKKIMPVQLPVPKMPGAEEKVPFSIDQSVYSSNEFYGKAKVTLSEPVQMRGHRAVLVSFWPVAYNPVTGDIKAITKAKISLKLSGSDIAGTRKMSAKYRSAAYDSPLSSTLINFGTYESFAKAVPALPINQLIIVGDEYYDALAPLADWDTRKGYRTLVTRTSEIPGGADTSHIRQYIKSQYDGENPPDFVLLVGDVDVVPTYYTNTVPNYPVTDLYYSTMAGTDFVPDLYVSRISVADTIQLHNYIAKYLDYQQGSWTSDHSWMQKAFFTASADYYTVTEATDNYCIARSRAHGMVCDSAYQRLGGSTVDITDAFNNGTTIMTYTGHGWYDSWGGPGFTPSNINSLTNSNKYSFVTSFSCLTGAFASGSYPECFGETWIRAANKGAVAFWGSSVLSYWDEDDILQRRMYDAFLDSGYTWIGGLTFKAKLDFGRYYNWASGPSVSVKIYFEQYNILGSGAIDLYTKQPLTMTVSHPATVPLGPATVNVNVAAGTAVQNALVCLTYKSNGEILATGYTDASGNVSLDIVTTILDSIGLVVTAHNCAPYSGQIKISVAGPCVLHYKHTINDSAGNGNSDINPGEAIALPLWVKNYGSVISTGTVKGTLRTTSNQAAITDSFYNFGLVYSGDSAQYSSGYKFNVSPACTNGTIIPFTLECHDTENSWTTNFTVKVSAPKLFYSTYCIIDPAPANNNSFAEPGETDSLRVYLKNKGLQTADNVTAILSSSDPYVAIVSDSSGYGDIQPDSAGGSAIPYLLTFGTPPQNPYYARLRLQMKTLGGTLVQYDSFMLAIASPGFYDNVEDSILTNQYQAGNLWHTTEYTAYSPTTCWRCGVGDDQPYINYMNSSLVTPEFAVGTQATVSFWHKYWIESNYDYGFVEYSTDDGSSWTELANFTGTLSDWTEQSYDINGIPVGSKVLLKFRFTSDVSVTGLGWHIDDISVTTPTGVAVRPEEPKLSGVLKLNRSHPNPMRSNAAISYQVPSKSQVTLTVYNILGQTIRLLDSGEKAPGLYQVNWDGRDSRGNNMSSGIYFYRLAAGAVTLTQKLILVR
ncbi:MAG: T9SS type A sorting domain-containing protein [Candidatus Edwardsbacteria bacterium]|nr:T9SS type A sorting domain-containing protein [Candidatus Edwardsbacteria bacterium]MBU1577357.1 T9SS type A sorting domain-containing protein [Candidatus Edwardsbacteria bacterium]MBU2463203.1 T9SS type A sorting domain-containing protein [Candidatus Edwardsbacteria bacterium]MBU2594174.1 T9SS type A sorting domain-containing protein [Candidatus Edwardsbacteria bacterium]